VKEFRMGGADYVTKPFQVEEVVARIEHQITIQQQKNNLKELEGKLLEQNQVLEQRNHYLHVLLTLTKLMNAADTLDSAIAQVLTQLCQVINWDYGEAWILNLGGTNLEKSEAYYARYDHCHDCYNSPARIGIQVKKAIVETTTESKEIQLITDLEKIDQRSTAGSVVSRRSTDDCIDVSNSVRSLPTAVREAGFQHLLSVPIIFKETVLAVLMFFSQGSNLDHQVKRNTVLSTDELNLIESAATQLGTLMQRLRTEVALKKANDKLQHLVSYDGLTEIANRRRFDEYLDEQWRQGKRDRGELSLILCDLDAFKAYNDHLGHQAGDQCLQTVAQTIEKIVNRPLDLVARYGGEEIAILLPYTSQIGAFQLGEKICEAIKNLQILHPHSPVSPYVTLSAGVSSIIPRDDCAPKLLIRMADNALYQAKEQGRDRVALNNYSFEQSND
jgi:diguanylate cyclase (GGDEF)-like protein